MILFSLNLPIKFRRIYVDPITYRIRFGTCQLIFGLHVARAYKLFLYPLFVWRPLAPEKDFSFRMLLPNGVEF